MSGRIPQEFIDDLIQRTDIVEVVGARVPLKKAGREYKACCPFHSEKTPSFWVSPQKGFYHCFGCGAHGTALGFVMEYDRLEFPAAVEELARLAGLDVPHADTGKARIEPLLTIMDEAARLYRQTLREHPEAVEYLRRRGLDGETARDFTIGYAPPGWDTLLTRLGTSESARQVLLQAGLTVARDTGGSYDRFRERIMFPIRDSRGRVIAFGGRTIGAGEPKYLNSPETPLFHKGRELYGLYEARRAERHLEQILVVEGYMDVVMLAAHGVRNAVATLGTATTAEHLRRLFGIAGEVVFCFDGDRAGRDAAWRALQVSLPLLQDGRQVRFLLLPDGEDPDSLVRREGTDAFNERVGNSLPLSTYLIETLSRETDTSTPDGRARLAALARPLLLEVPDDIYRELLTAAVAGRIGLPANRLHELLGQETASATGKPGPVRAAAVQPAGRGSMVRQAIGVMLHFPGVAAQVPLPQEVMGSAIRGIPLLAELHAIAASRPDLPPAALLERFRGRRELPHLEQLMAEESLVSAEGAVAEFADSIERLRQADRQAAHARLIEKFRQGTLTDGEREQLRVLEQAGIAHRDGPAA